jgi:hypothetical protein
LTGSSHPHKMRGDVTRELGRVDEAKGARMTLREILNDVRYVTDASGERTDVVIPLTNWNALLAVCERLTELAADQEDRVVLREWLAKRATGKAESISLDDLEKELRTDGLLSG